MSVYQTHEVENQPPPLVDYNVYAADRCLRAAVQALGGADFEPQLHAFGAEIGSGAVIELGHLANRHPPELRTHDRYGHRINEVEFHPAWHALMTLGMAHQVHALPWNDARPGAHVARAALAFLMNQAENGVCCPLAMSFAAVPVLRRQPEVAALWEPRLRATAYDKRPIPAADKTAATIAMAMTEKQGGSDVRANTTRAVPEGTGGPGAAYRLTGHKWFFSAPMSDAFLTLAYTDEGLSCVLVPRWLPDGTRNRFTLQRLKDKLGNRSNASSEIEYHDTWGLLIGEPGRGVATIIDMVNHTRLDAAICSAALMRQALAQATHHAAHRSAFQKRLIDQPLMQNVLADLTVESEAATLLVMRVAQSFDAAARDKAARSFARIVTAVAKYWVCKRAPGFVFEALECQGGNAYIEESVMPRLYREAPLNSVWEGCGNVICLDILRAMAQDPATIDTYRAELERARDADPRLDRTIDDLGTLFANPAILEPRSRQLAETMALALQAALLLQYGRPAVAEAFCATRLDGAGGFAHGTLPEGHDLRAIIDGARPEISENPPIAAA